MAEIKPHASHYVYAHLFPVQWKMSINLMSKMRMSGGWGGQPCWLTDFLPTRMWYTRSLMLGFRWGNWHRCSMSGHQPVLGTLALCSAVPPPSLWRAAALTQTSKRRNGHVVRGGGLAGEGVGLHKQRAPPPPVPPRGSSVGHLWGTRRD